ncbi:MAG: hypothetical protein KA185_17810 [Vitreoscilla sp.]|nr:hypothetical protein [Vitreoscilla sp.]
MRLSDLGGAGNDEFNMRPLAHAFVPKGSRLHTVNAVARGFCVLVAEWTTAPHPTSSSRAPSYLTCFGVTRSHGPDDAQCCRRIWIGGDCRPTINKHPMPWLREAGRKVNHYRLALLRPSSDHQEADMNPDESPEDAAAVQRWLDNWSVRESMTPEQRAEIAPADNNEPEPF